MSRHRSHSLPKRWRLALVLTVAAGAAIASTSLASAGSKQAPNKVVVKAVSNGNKLSFDVSSGTINAGGSLVIKNSSGAPHTLSLVTGNLVPKTKSDLQKCFSKGHICKAIAKWHKIQGNNVGVKTVDVGNPGWDTEGNLKRKGDSVFFSGNKNPATRAVSASPGTTLHFMCAIHPEMHGTIHVR